MEAYAISNIRVLGFKDLEEDLGALPQTPRFFEKNLVKFLLKD